MREHGGIRPLNLGPHVSVRLDVLDRARIESLLEEGCSIRDIARRLGRAPSTISREIRRNAATRGGRTQYRARTAQWHAEKSARRPRASKLAANEALHTYVQDRLAGRISRDGVDLGPSSTWRGKRPGPMRDRRWTKAWSPQQISYRLKIDYPDDESMRISHEAIYQALFVQGKGALKRELTESLRTGRALRIPEARMRRPGMSFVSDDVMIANRPAEAADRAVPGHWEGDLIIGAGGSAIGTLVERTTRFVMLLHLPADPTIVGHGSKGHSAIAVRDAMTATISTLPEQLRRTLTWDQGPEMAAHASFTIATGIPVYFCDPHSPWQRGTNENTNGLLRQYFPKGTDLHRWSRDDLDAVAETLNGRPRKTLGWRTPAEALNALIDNPPNTVALTD